MRTTLLRSITAATALGASALTALPAAAQQAAAPPAVTVGGVIYSQFLYQLKDSAGAGNQNQFSVQRAYINAIGRFGTNFLARATLDLAPTGAPGNQPIRLKYAYGQYTPDGSALSYKFGLIHTPWLDWEESLWDYRMQGTMALDRNKYLTSSDFGAGIDGKWNNDQFNGQVTVVNGEGYSGGTGDAGKDIQARLSLRLVETDDASRVGGLRVTAYAGYGSPTGSGQRQRFVGMLSYRSKMITLAGEFASAVDSTTAPATAQKTGQVISAFAVVKVPDSPVGLIARVDLVDPNTAAASINDKQTRIIAGISYQVTPQFRLLANIDNLTYENPAPTAAQIAVQSQALFQAQITF
ncbi:MAG TPA: porin [Gemmatimonadales bacterium]